MECFNQLASAESKLGEGTSLGEDRKKDKSNENGSQIKEQVLQEICAAVTLAVSVLLFLSLYHSGMGYVGGIIQNILTWTMGRAAWLIPTFILVGGLLWLGQLHLHYSSRLCGLFLAGVAISGLYHSQLQAADPLSNAAAQAGGGYLGAVLYWSLTQAFGRVGMFIVLGCTGFVSVLLLINIPASELISKLSRSVGKLSEKLWHELIDFITISEETTSELTPSSTATESEVRIHSYPQGSGEKPQTSSVAQVDKQGSVASDKAPEETENCSQQHDETPSVNSVPGSEGKDKSSNNLKNSKQEQDEQGQQPETEESDGFSPTGEAEQVKLDMSEIYTLPTPDLLHVPSDDVQGSGRSKAQLNKDANKLEATLESFGVEGRVIEISHGPTVTRFDLHPGRGVKVSQIASLADDIALSLASSGVRVVAPVPGKSAVGVEVPNRELTPVHLKEIVESKEFRDSDDPLTVALGTDITGKPMVTRLGDLLHVLIAGATGSGKSICIRCILASILFKARPDQVKFLLIDPKVVEFRSYDGLPHLLAPVVTDPQKAAGCLTWAVKEMERRYEKFAETGVRDLPTYNKQASRHGDKEMPRLVIIIDELADLMTVAKVDVEDAIQRLAQMARAAGIHLIVATQRPSVDVITGVIKANIPSRIAFAVSSGHDSRTILDTGGAEKLVGSGDMLFAPVGREKPVRTQGSFLSDSSLYSLLDFVSKQVEPEFHDQVIKEAEKVTETQSPAEQEDPKLEKAIEIVLERGEASVSMLQRKLRVGYTRAGRLIDTMESMGIVGPHQGPKSRDVTMTKAAYRELKEGEAEKDTDEGADPAAESNSQQPPEQL